MVRGQLAVEHEHSMRMRAAAAITLSRYRAIALSHHRGAVLLGLLRGGAQVGQDDRVGVGIQHIVGEVAHVAACTRKTRHADHQARSQAAMT